jgi:opacity protein-like surface antigen
VYSGSVTRTPRHHTRWQPGLRAIRDRLLLLAALFGLALGLATSGLPAIAHAQTSLLAPAPPGSESAAVSDATMPGWYQRSGEGPFALRDPLSGLYFLIGAHGGFSERTRLADDKGCSDPAAFFLGCDNTPPSEAPGTGYGGSVGIGTRITPALRTALTATVDSGYRFRNAHWVDRSSGETFDEDFSLRSYQATANLYLDIAGLLMPGALGRFNPYLMTGMGVAVNVTGDTTERETPPGVPGWNNTYPGSTRTSFLWTAGAGMQYQIVSGVIADLSYQYVDAGRFRAADGTPQINGFNGLPFQPPFDSFRGNLRTHRIGFAINIELEGISRLFSGR